VLNTNGVININTATAEQLEALDRVGPALARRIIEHRKVRGPFQSIEALVDVPGIGPKILERNRHRITVR
jgi:competence protein ComEA